MEGLHPEAGYMTASVPKRVFSLESPLTARAGPYMYLHPADNYHRLTWLTFTRAKRPSREGSHGLPAALSPLVRPSTPAAWTHVACSGPLLWLFPTTTAGSHPCGLRPRRHEEEQRLAQGPHMVGQPRGHGWCLGLPPLGRAGAMGGCGLRQRQA